MEVRLRVLNEKSNFKRVVMRKNAVIGSGKDCNLRLSAGGVESRHCELRLQDDGVFVKDLLGSRSVLVNGHHIDSDEDVPVASGSTLEIGSARFVVKYEQPARSRANGSNGNSAARPAAAMDATVIESPTIPDDDDFDIDAMLADDESAAPTKTTGNDTGFDMLDGEATSEMSAAQATLELDLSSLEAEELDDEDEAVAVAGLADEDEDLAATVSLVPPMEAAGEEEAAQVAEAEDDDFMAFLEDDAPAAVADAATAVADETLAVVDEDTFTEDTEDVEATEEVIEDAEVAEEKPAKKKKGLLGSLFGRGKKAAKEKSDDDDVVEAADVEDAVEEDAVVLALDLETETDDDFALDALGLDDTVEVVEDSAADDAAEVAVVADAEDEDFMAFLTDDEPPTDVIETNVAATVVELGEEVTAGEDEEDALAFLSSDDADDAEELPAFALEDSSEEPVFVAELSDEEEDDALAFLAGDAEDSDDEEPALAFDVETPVAEVIVDDSDDEEEEPVLAVELGEDAEDDAGDAIVLDEEATVGEAEDAAFAALSFDVDEPDGKASETPLVLDVAEEAAGLDDDDIAGLLMDDDDDDQQSQPKSKDGDADELSKFLDQFGDE